MQEGNKQKAKYILYISVALLSSLLLLILPKVMPQEKINYPSVAVGKVFTSDTSNDRVSLVSANEKANGDMDATFFIDNDTPDVATELKTKVIATYFNGYETELKVTNINNHLFTVHLTGSANWQSVTLNIWYADGLSTVFSGINTESTDPIEVALAQDKIEVVSEFPTKAKLFELSYSTKIKGLEREVVKLNNSKKQLEADNKKYQTKLDEISKQDLSELTQEEQDNLNSVSDKLDSDITTNDSEINRITEEIDV
ncbi:MAG: hypothetical protein LBV67_01995, partial [Streptococcaceae bacterium]|nr:hypothetical protein [Streptococcaceae bacterium]